VKASGDGDERGQNEAQSRHLADQTRSWKHKKVCSKRDESQTPKKTKRSRHAVDKHIGGPNPQ
jgi:hypothetical protein